MSDEYTIGSDDKVARLEKRGRGFRRLITAINDLPLVVINVIGFVVLMITPFAPLDAP